jgi:oligopeptide transport system substrate-binding protein
LTILNELITPLYSTEVDWELAISEGVANYVGDLSKIESGLFSIDELHFKDILVGAKSFPKDSNGNNYTFDGKLDRMSANLNQSTEWTFELRDDVFFENGTQVNASIYEFSLKQYLDPLQQNRRASNFYRRIDSNDSGIPIVNAGEYRFQNSDSPVLWDSVGFEIIDEFTFKITTWTAISQSTAFTQ